MAMLCVCLQAQQNRRIGVNIADISNFSSQFVYVDAMKQASPWLVQPLDASVFNIEGATVPEGPNGYPGFAPFEHEGQMVQPHVAIYNTMPEPWLYPAGEYTLIFEGTGRVTLQWDVENELFSTTEANTPHHIRVIPTTLGLNLVINESDASDPIRNIRLILPGFEESYEQAPFHPSFLDLLEPFEVLRFMKPLAVEENQLSRWEDRTEVDHYTYVTEEWNTVRFGMPYEHVADIGNLVQRDVWINVPFSADDEFLTNLATLFRDRLDENLNLYIEYANEAWNPLYPEVRQYMIDQGRALDLGEGELEANMRYHALRSFQIWEIFRTVFGERSGQIMEVMGSWSWVDAGRITIDAIKDPEVNPNGDLPDGIAIATYVGVEAIHELIQRHGECGFDSDDILDELEQILEPEMDEYMEMFSFWSDSTGIELMAYESGQHVSAANFENNSECLAEAIRQANRSERMGDILCRLYDRWYETYDGGLSIAFVLAEPYGIAGSFGILESTLQDPSTSQKWTAMQECIFAENAVPVMQLNANLSFADTPVGSTSMSQFSIMNAGESDLIVTSITFPTGFEGNWTSGTITPGSTQNIEVTFRPTEVRTYSGDILIESNAGNAQLNVQAEGVAVTSIDRRSSSNLVRLYPNPTANELFLDVSAVTTMPMHFRLLNTNGAVLSTAELAVDRPQRVDISKIPEGIYFVQIQGASGNFIKKLLIKR